MSRWARGCPAARLVDCRCSRREGILCAPPAPQGIDLTHYPESGLLVVMGTPYMLAGPWIARPHVRGHHFMTAILSAIYTERAVLIPTVLSHNCSFDSYFHAVCTNPDGSLELIKLRVSTRAGGLPIAKHIARLQRWMRALVRTRREARRLTAAMALHARLGNGSLLAALGADALQLCLGD